jgi:hypothetical protein
MSKNNEPPSLISFIFMSILADISLRRIVISNDIIQSHVGTGNNSFFFRRKLLNDAKQTTASRIACFFWEDLI